MRPRHARLVSVHLAGLLAGCHCIVALAVPPCRPMPRPIQSVSPEFPPWESREPLNAKITVEFLINIDGTIEDPKITAVDPEHFENVVKKSALAAAHQLKFKPVATQCRGKFRIAFATVN